MAARMRGSWKTLGVVLQYGGIRRIVSVSRAALAAASLTLGCSASTPLPPSEAGGVENGEGMKHPEMISMGEAPKYSEEALAQRAEGLMVVRCTIDIEGRVTNCRVQQSIPHMEKAVLDALYTRRYKPGTFNGKPVNIDYVFNIKLVLPPPPPPPPPSDLASTAPPSTASSPPPPPSPSAPDPAAQEAAPPPPANVVIPFGAGMNRPQLISGKDPVYSREALVHRVEGLMIVRCTINIEGRVTNCRIIKSLPYMEKTVLDALYSRRYTPVLYKGRPVNVDYVFNLKLVLPTLPAPPAGSASPAPP